MTLCDGCDQQGATALQWLDLGDRTVTVRFHPDETCATQAQEKRGGRYVESPYAEQDRRLIAGMRSYVEWLRTEWAPRWEAEQHCQTGDREASERTSPC